MKAVATLFSILIFSPLWTYAQEEPEKYKAPQGLTNIYLELGGAGLFYSLNYEKYLVRSRSGKLAWTGRVGAGFNPIDYRLLNKVYLEQNSFMFPFSTSMLYGRAKEQLELGGGFTMLTRNFTRNEVFMILAAGVRVMESNKVCFRFTYTPHIRMGAWIDWFGVSLGRNF